MSSPFKEHSEVIIEKAKVGLVDITITDPDNVIVEVQTTVTRDIIWVNVNGVCRLRICKIKNLNLDIPPLQ